MTLAQYGVVLRGRQRLRPTHVKRRERGVQSLELGQPRRVVGRQCGGIGRAPAVRDAGEQIATHRSHAVAAFATSASFVNAGAS